jgi:hypothetical protein
VKIKELHESEISVFQQLCLNKHHENAAIEILLESSESLPDLYAASSSGSTENGSRTLSKEKVKSVEGKKKFLDRFFFKSPKKSFDMVQTASNSVNVRETPLEPSFPLIKTPSKSENDENVLIPPSTIPNFRTQVEESFGSFSSEGKSHCVSTVESTFTGNDSTEKECYSDEMENFSNFSSLSGTRASSYMMPIDHVMTAALLRKAIPSEILLIKLHHFA